ncbi:MAG: hypothetical protein NWF06_11190 [Candidatus Bathyarchaeota archaeon]|nr:hypothetical protein [Candidatus Bathyarchaeum sp.]
MSIELALSTIAIIISLCGLILHFLKFRKERPNLVIKKITCRHHPKSDDKNTELRIDFTVHNRGDRGTQINSLELPAYEMLYILDHQLDAHKSIHENHHFTIPLSLTNKELQCLFMLHHTHGDKTIEVCSIKVPYSLSRTYRD